MSFLHSEKKGVQILTDAGCFVAGSCLYAISISVFAAPNQIAPGGVTGLATILNTLIHTPIGTVAFLLNIPIIIWAMLEIGYKVVIKTIVAIVISSLVIDLSALFLPAYQGDHMLAAIFAGVLEGIGLSLIFIRGGTTGGTDMTARLLNRRFPHLSMGKLMMTVDMMVITLSAFVYWSIESALYALIVIFVATRVIDAILYGLDIGTGKLLFIISDQGKRISTKIIETLGRGVTILSGHGAYSGQERDVLFCAVRKYEVHRALHLIREIDKRAFIIIGEAGQITGEGFREEKAQEKSVRELLSRKKKEQS
ncbi:MAG: YitT family protein [Clostridiales bacterium]|nr:YitT family protein [Clostridiales bacterium]